VLRLYRCNPDPNLSPQTPLCVRQLTQLRACTGRRFESCRAAVGGPSRAPAAFCPSWQRRRREQQQQKSQALGRTAAGTHQLHCQVLHRRRCCRFALLHLPRPPSASPPQPTLLFKHRACCLSLSQHPLSTPSMTALFQYRRWKSRLLCTCSHRPTPTS
jgi:hypothetical protein